MGKKAILFEKPSAMRNGAKAFGGISGTFNGEEFVLCCARGHLYEFRDPSKQVSTSLQKKYHSWLLSNMPWDPSDFTWSYDKKPDVDDTLMSIQDVFLDCDEIVIATDDDPSGEGTLLADEIIINLGFDHDKKISRMFFADESVKSLQNAFKSRKCFNSVYDDPDYKKALYRAKWDFCSMQWTRIATKCGNNEDVLREGRLKSYMVVLVGDQLALVAAYKKVPFYQYRFKDDNNNTFVWPDEPKFPTKDQVPQNKYGKATVVPLEKVRKSSAPPKLIDLATLSARLAPKGFKAKEVMSTYQKMYEAQVVSYPRTEDKAITLEQFNELLPLCDDIARVVGVDPALLVNKKPRAGFVKEGMAHGANRPGINVPKSMSDLATYGKCAEDIYYILATSYLAMLCADYEYDSQDAYLKEYPDFKSHVNVPVFAGWKAVYNDDSDTDDTENTAGFGTIADPFIYEGFPPKPQTPTMKWLMKQLEKADVGTGATRTSTYAEMSNDKSKTAAFKDTKGKISMTNCGTMSYKVIQGTHIASAELTKHVFDDMKEIAAGRKDPDECLKEIAVLIVEDMEIMRKNGEKMREELGIKLKGSEDVERFEGTWNGEQVSVKRVWSNHRFTDEEVADLLAGKDIVIEAISSAGKPFKYKGHLARQTYKGKSFIGFDGDFVKESGSSDDAERFEGVWKKKKVTPKRIWSGYRFTDEECQKLLAGEEITIEAVSQKTGKKFKCKGKLENQTYNGNSFVGFKNTGFVN